MFGYYRLLMGQLIRREYGITVSLITVRRYLQTWGLSLQKPVRRAYERNDAAIACWLKREYPAIARHARQEPATISWGDEMGLRWLKTVRLLRKLTLRGERQVGWLFTFAAEVYKLVWTRNFVEVAA